jgi:hypothetical protein
MHKFAAAAPMESAAGYPQPSPDHPRGDHRSLCDLRLSSHGGSIEWRRLKWLGPRVCKGWTIEFVRSRDIRRRWSDRIVLRNERAGFKEGDAFFNHPQEHLVKSDEA